MLRLNYAEVFEYNQDSGPTGCLHGYNSMLFNTNINTRQCGFVGWSCICKEIPTGACANQLKLQRVQLDEYAPGCIEVDDSILFNTGNGVQCGSRCLYKNDILNKRQRIFGEFRDNFIIEYDTYCKFDSDEFISFDKGYFAETEFELLTDIRDGYEVVETNQFCQDDTVFYNGALGPLWTISFGKTFCFEFCAGIKGSGTAMTLTQDPPTLSDPHYFIFDIGVCNDSPFTQELDLSLDQCKQKCTGITNCKHISYREDTGHCQTFPACYDTYAAFETHQRRTQYVTDDQNYKLFTTYSTNIRTHTAQECAEGCSESVVAFTNTVGNSAYIVQGKACAGRSLKILKYFSGHHLKIVAGDLTWQEAMDADEIVLLRSPGGFTFTPTENVYTYICTSHSSMIGKINLEQCSTEYSKILYDTNTKDCSCVQDTDTANMNSCPFSHPYLRKAGTMYYCYDKRRYIDVASLSSGYCLPDDKKYSDKTYRECEILCDNDAGCNAFSYNAVLSECVLSSNGCDDDGEYTKEGDYGYPWLRYKVNTEGYCRMSNSGVDPPSDGQWGDSGSDCELPNVYTLSSQVPTGSTQYIFEDTRSPPVYVA